MITLPPPTPPKIPLQMIGRWFDVYKYVNGKERPGHHGEFKWGFNQIQNSFMVLIAAWCRGEVTYDRIDFLALGNGLALWDVIPPAQPHSQSSLVAEVYRESINQANIVYLDPATGLPTGGTPSSYLQITCTIDTTEANGQALREFALFGGTATGVLGSGQMVNWVVHPRIDKTALFSIIRTITLQFQEL